AAMPDVFIASAVADSGVAVLQAVEDLVQGMVRTDAIEKIGLKRPEAVRLTMSSTVSAEVRRRVEAVGRSVQAGGSDCSDNLEWCGIPKSGLRREVGGS